MSEYLIKQLDQHLIDGWAKYNDSYEDSDQPRIVVQARIENSHEVIEMILDTASPWNILSREIAREYGELPPPEDTIPLSTRLGKIYGQIVPFSIKLLMSHGRDIDIEGQFFIPNDDNLSIPNFIGYQGCLQRIKTVLDPQHNGIGFSLYSGI